MKKEGGTLIVEHRATPGTTPSAWMATCNPYAIYLQKRVLGRAGTMHSSSSGAKWVRVVAHSHNSLVALAERSTLQR